jgi:hypothetical protein
MTRTILATASAVVFSSAAFAQKTTAFYVVQDTTTKQCTVVDTKPTASTMVVVGDGVFKTRTEAETNMKSIKVCTSN